MSPHHAQLRSKKSNSCAKRSSDTTASTSGGETVISDLEFDRLLKRLQQLEREHPELDSPDSPSHKVGGEPIEGFVTVEHRQPMLSIENYYTEPELRDFDERLRKLSGLDAMNTPSSTRSTVSPWL